MSDLRIALVAEGPTDYVLIEAALKAVLGPKTFVLNQLQPEATNPSFGNGWGGVLKWCVATAERSVGSLDDDLLLKDFDLLILHLDTDVAHQGYANCGPSVVAMAATWPGLPCSQPCPPVTPTSTALQFVLEGWLKPAVLGTKTVVCIPAQSTGTWLAAAVLPPTHALLHQMECNPYVEDALSRLPKLERIKKTPREYRAKANTVSQQWAQVKALCGQAVHFESAVQAALR